MVGGLEIVCWSRDRPVPNDSVQHEAQKDEMPGGPLVRYEGTKGAREGMTAFAGDDLAGCLTCDQEGLLSC